MVLNERNCAEKINAYTRKDWEPLFALIPKIENTSTFGKLVIEKDKNGAIHLPYYKVVPVVSQFLKVIYTIPIMIGFDWSAWDEGIKILGDKNFDFNFIGLVTKCKLITAIVRNDRFCEGVLVAAFKSGLILKILKSMEKDVNNNE